MTKLFKAFGKLDDKRGLNKEGVGLGLMISRDIVEAMQGTIHVESLVGEGTTFKFEMVVGIIQPQSSNADQSTIKQINSDINCFSFEELQKKKYRKFSVEQI